MEEKFSELLEKYLNEEEINKKIENEEIEYKTEEQEYESKTSHNINKYDSISMHRFITEYLNKDISLIDANNLTHKGLKELMGDNPFLVGIHNDVVDIDEAIKMNYLVVEDKLGNRGAYLNPQYIKNLIKFEYIEKKLDEVKKKRIITFNKLEELYKEFMDVVTEYELLEEMCTGCLESIKKAHKAGKYNEIKSRVNKHLDNGENILDTEIINKKKIY